MAKIPVIDVVPAELVLEWTLQHSEYLAVHVILAHAEEQKPANHPAEAPGKNAGLRETGARRRRNLPAARFRFCDEILFGHLAFGSQAALTCALLAERECLAEIPAGC